MTSKVHELSVVKTDGPKPNERIIERVRELLKDCKSGRVQGLAIGVAIYAPDEPNTNYRLTENVFCYTDTWKHQTFVAACSIHRRAYDDILGASEPVPTTPLTDGDE
jgi:hypothetical protein